MEVYNFMTREEEIAEIRRIKNYAIDENIPIMLDDGIEFLTSFIEKKQIKKHLFDLHNEFSDNQVYMTPLSCAIKNINLTNDFEILKKLLYGSS